MLLYKATVFSVIVFTLYSLKLHWKIKNIITFTFLFLSPAARTQWHELFMSTMLLDIHFKKEFAILLTKVK